ncbi:MAG: glycosyltransferase [Oscillospiraceae bacterium]|nr:glycosyltransferase [Oscillospiraceae bacterium]
MLVNLANCMADDEYDITLRVLTNTGENRKNLSNKVKYEYVFKKNFKGINYLHLLPRKWIYKKVAHGCFDVIVVYLHGVLTKIVSYAPKAQKTVAYLHANMEKSPFIKSFKDKSAIQNCFKSYDRIVSVSREVQNSFTQASGINDKRLVVKYNTFDVDKIKALACEPINIKFAEKHGISICTVGKLETVKGHKRLLSVMKRLITNGMAAQLTIVGDGPLKSELQEYINDNNLHNYVSLVGFDTNPYKYVAKSDLFVCSSFSEGFSSVVAESLILGVPVVTTDCAGMREMLGDNNEYGAVVNNDEDSLYQGIFDMIANSDKLEHYRKAAQQRGKFFEPQQTVGAVEKMLEEILNEQ